MLNEALAMIDVLRDDARARRSVVLAEILTPPQQPIQSIDDTIVQWIRMAAWSTCGLFERIGYGAGENLHVLNIVVSSGAVLLPSQNPLVVRG